MVTEGLACAATIGNRTLAVELMEQWVAQTQGGPPAMDASSGQQTLFLQIPRENDDFPKTAIFPYVKRQLRSENAVFEHLFKHF